VRSGCELSSVSVVALGCLLAICACGPSHDPEPSARHNFLILIADDLGVAKLGAFARDADAGAEPGESLTPQLDALASRGVHFTNAWSYPVCSPTRANALTGRYGFRTGVGSLVPSPGSRRRPLGDEYGGLETAETTLPEMLGSGFASAAFGKWHLAGLERGAPDPDHPRQSGFDHFAGTLENLHPPESYRSWSKNVNGSIAPSFVYATTDSVDDVLTWVRRSREPWLAWVAFHAPHPPWHEPPDALHRVHFSSPPTRAELHDAMTQSLDSEIGRLLAGIEPDVMERTTVVFFADNGTPRGADADMPDRGKGLLYEPGIRVPFIVAGPDVVRPGRAVSAPIATVDLFATLGEIAGRPHPTGEDSVSLLPYLRGPDAPPQRQFVYAERFKPNGPGTLAEKRLWRQALRDARYKLIRRDCADEELFDLDLDPGERRNLLETGEPATPEASAAYDRLRTALDARVDIGCADGDPNSAPAREGIR
jgi:arylsulfatase A-like enzyme